jgi:hypothetical protein
MLEEVRACLFEPSFLIGRGSGGTCLSMTIAHSLVTNELKDCMHVNSAPN